MTILTGRLSSGRQRKTTGRLHQEAQCSRQDLLWVRLNPFGLACADIIFFLQKWPRSVVLLPSRTAPLPIHLPTSNRILKEPLSGWASSLTSTTCIELTPVRPQWLQETCTFSLIDPSTDTPLEQSIPALDEIKTKDKTKYIGLSECSAQTLRKANFSMSLDHIVTRVFAHDPAQSPKSTPSKPSIPLSRRCTRRMALLPQQKS